MVVLVAAPLASGANCLGPVRDGCQTDRDCADDELCRPSQESIDTDGPGACVAADGIPYQLGLVDVRICERMLDGSGWDVGAGAPDPFMMVEVNGVVTSTAAVQDVFNAGDFVLELELSSTDVVNLYLVDEDLTENDAISGYCLAAECGQAIGVERLRTMYRPVGDAGCASDAIAEAMLVVVPAPMGFGIAAMFAPSVTKEAAEVDSAQKKVDDAAMAF